MSMKSAEVSFREYSKVQRGVSSRAETHIPAPSGHTDSISAIKKAIFLIFNIFNFTCCLTILNGSLWQHISEWGYQENPALSYLMTLPTKGLHITFSCYISLSYQDVQLLLPNFLVQHKSLRSSPTLLPDFSTLLLENSSSLLDYSILLTALTSPLTAYPTASKRLTRACLTSHLL